MIGLLDDRTQADASRWIARAAPVGEWFLVPVASPSLQPQLAVADRIADAVVEFLVVPPVTSSYDSGSS